jgi:hypothetical protein
MANAIGVGPRVAALGALLLATAGARAAPAADRPAAPIYLRAGQEVTLPVMIQGDRVILGVPRLSKLGTARPRPGEITIGLTPGDKDLYAHVIATERTAVPIDFVATGLVGEIKIDERVLCGRLDQPFSVHIGSVSWRVSLNTFEVGKGGECR